MCAMGPLDIGEIATIKRVASERTSIVDTAVKS
jgi:hypothetical protein